MILIRLPLLFVLLFCAIFMAAQQDRDALLPLLEKAASVQQFSRTYPQEKAYLHFDNTGYFIGETIWFKAYVTRTDTDRPTDLSGVLYVELLSPAGDVVEFVLNSSSLSRIAPIVVRFDADAYDYTKHDSVASESIDAAEMYSRIYLPQASGKDTVLASFDLLNGKVNDPSVTREYENNRDFDVLVGQDAFASMRLVTESGDFSLRMAAHMDYDAIVKFTVKQNSVVSITHPAAGFDVWAFDTRGIKIVAEDAEGTRVTLLNKKILQSELTDSRYAADQYGLSGIHLGIPLTGTNFLEKVLHLFFGFKDFTV